MAQPTRRPINLGFDLASFRGHYSFTGVWGPLRQATLGVGVSDGKGGFYGTQRINAGTGSFLETPIDGGYKVAPDGMVLVSITFPLPGFGDFEADLCLVPFLVEQARKHRLITQLQGIDTQPGVDVANGQPFEPPMLGLANFRWIPGRG